MKILDGDPLLKFSGKSSNIWNRKNENPDLNYKKDDFKKDEKLGRWHGWICATQTNTPSPKKIYYSRWELQICGNLLILMDFPYCWSSR